MGCLTVLRTISQIVLVIVNIIVTLLGLAVLILGSWAHVNGLQLFQIADNSSVFLSVSVLLIILGVFIAIIGIVGTVGAIFASSVFGRILLGLYAIVLGLLVICEIAGGIAAAVKQDDLDDFFRASSNRSFLQFNNDSSINATWNGFQKTFHCCGVESWKDYQIFWRLGVVPMTCCNVTTVSPDVCASIHFNVNQSVVDDYKIYDQGCVEAVIGDLRGNLGAISGGAIAIGFLQIVAVVLACFVAIYKHRENKYEVV